MCAVCTDGATYDYNEILFCEKCNIAVHQDCYGIERVPSGDWYACVESFLRIASY